MNISRLSNSSAKTYEACNLSYYIEYGLGWRFPVGKAANLGTICHKVLETLGKINRCFDSDGIYEAPEYGISLQPDAYFSLDQVFTPIFNHYSKGEFKEDCYTRSERKKCLEWVNYAVNHNDGAFSPLLRGIVDLEKYFKIPIKEDWAKIGDSYLHITGIIDCVYTTDWEDQYEVVDWKTGQRKDWHTGEELNVRTLRNNLQLKMYYYAAHELYGYDKDYFITMFFLKDGGPYTVHFPKDDIEHTKYLLKNKFLKIRNDIRPRPNRTWKCRFCPFYKNTFENTNINILKQEYEGGIAEKGQTCTICDQVNNELNLHTIDLVTANYKKQR